MVIAGAVRRVAAATAVAAALACAHTAHAGPRPRPNDVPAGSVETSIAPNPFQVFNDYSLPERMLWSREAVVHYVAAGIDAPPLNDDDGDGVPDYVERVGEAADTAAAYYRRRGFSAIRPDTGGPDARPDLYVSRFMPGVFGAAIPHGSAVGGAYAAIANNLDPSAERSVASVYGTVAHEVFHLVQFSYFPLNIAPDLPLWVLEGTAAAMETRVYPDLDDLVSTIQLRTWFAAPQRSLVSQTYGAQLFWGHLDRRFPRLLPTYLRRLGARIHSGDASVELGGIFARVTGRQLATTFHRFAVAAVCDHAEEFRGTRTLRTGAGLARVAPLGLRLLRVRVPREGTAALVVSLRSHSPLVAATLMYRVAPLTPGDPPTFVRVHGAVQARTLRFTLRPLERRDRRASRALLVVTGAVTRAVDVTTGTTRDEPRR